MPNFDYLLGGQVAQVDPMRIALQGATLADIASQAKLRQRLLQMQQDQDESQSVYQQAMPELYRGGQLTQDNFARVMQDPRFGKALPLLEGFADKTMKAQAELRKSEAEMLDKRSQANERSWKVLGGMAAEVADNPTPQNLQRLSAQAKYMNVELPLPPSPFGSVEDLKGYASLLAAGATDPKARADIWRIKQETPANVAEKTALTGKHNAEVQYMPREIAAKEMSARASATSAGAAATNAQTNRLQFTNPAILHDTTNGGFLVPQRTIGANGQVFTALNNPVDSSGNPLPKPVNFKQVESIRQEINKLQDVQNYRAAVPMLQSAANAPNTPAGDLDVIYAVGKALDPNSVVREGELNLVIKSGSPAQVLQGYVNYVMGGGRLAPAQRAELMTMLRNRIGELGQMHSRALAPYQKQIEAQGLPADQIFIDPGSIAAPAATTGGWGKVERVR